MREQTLSGLKLQTGLLPGMLKRSKYSRLRSDSPQRLLPMKRDLCCLDPDFAQLDPGTLTHHHGPSPTTASSTLRDFIPRVANIRLHSPVSLQCLRGQTYSGQRTLRGHTDREEGPNQRFCSQPSLNLPLSTTTSDHQDTSNIALRSTKRPITLQRMASLPWTSSSCSQQHRDALGSVRTANKAVHHHIKYMGSVEVTQSMRTLDFDTRMKVTREAISRLCERTSTRTTVKTKRLLCKGLSAVLGQVNLQFSGSRIILAVSTESLTLISASSLQKIALHPMQAISFASGGDPNMADYIAYVAKDLVNQRACHILECPQGRAAEVINSIGQAFETRFRQLLSHTPALLSPNPRSAMRLCDEWSPEETIAEGKAEREGEGSEHRDYYNVIPGKTPPAGGVRDLRITRKNDKQDADTQEVCWSQPVSLYENCSITEDTPAPPADWVKPEASAERCQRQTRDLIREEGWFHGRLGREQAESLLSCSGDFLVRESSSACGQYVLSGMEGDTARHLLLVDPHGQVRTRDQVFVSVAHLVRFHMEKQMPIVSGSSELCLKQPVLHRH